MEHQLASQAPHLCGPAWSQGKVVSCMFARSTTQPTFGLSFSNSIVLIFSAALAVCGRTTEWAAGMTKAWAQPIVTIAKAQAVFMIRSRGGAAWLRDLGLGTRAESKGARWLKKKKKLFFFGFSAYLLILCWHLREQGRAETPAKKRSERLEYTSGCLVGVQA